jgi:hypothetical protein
VTEPTQVPRWLALAVSALLVLAVWQQIQGLQDCVVVLKTKAAPAAADVCPTTEG